MKSPVFPLSPLTTDDYVRFVCDTANHCVSMSTEADAIISYLIDKHENATFAELHDACRQTVAQRYGVAVNAIKLDGAIVQEAVKWLSTVGIVCIMDPIGPANPMANCHYSLGQGFRDWISECGDVVHRPTAPRSFSRPGNLSMLQPHVHEAFSELADVAMMDPRMRDILMDLQHMGQKATRVLSGS